MTINVFAQTEPDQAQLQTNCQHGNQFACNALNGNQPNGNPGCTIQVPGEPPLQQGCPQMANPNSR